MTWYTTDDARRDAERQAVTREHNRLVREMDVAMNGEEGAAPQASLCDLVSQAGEMRKKLDAFRAEAKAQKERAEYHEQRHRDLVIENIALRAEVERLTICLNRANFQAEEFERKWYLRGDEVERLRSALLTLADAADDVGVRHFDGDTLPASVERMQTATATARAALQEPTP